MDLLIWRPEIVDIFDCLFLNVTASFLEPIQHKTLLDSLIIAFLVNGEIDVVI